MVVETMDVEGGGSVVSPISKVDEKVKEGGEGVAGSRTITPTTIERIMRTNKSTRRTDGEI
jgi:hypothetical protein